MQAAMLLVSSFRFSFLLLGAKRQYEEIYWIHCSLYKVRDFLCGFVKNVPSVTFQLQPRKKRQYL